MTAPDWDSLKPAAPNWDDLRPADHGLSDIREKAIAALPESMQDVARKALSGVAPSWTHNPASYSPYKPANPNSMPNDAINPVGTDTQMVGATAAAGAGSVGARMLARATEGAPPGPIPGIARPPPMPAEAPAPNFPRGVSPENPVNLQPPSPVIRGPGGQWQPNPAYKPAALDPPPLPVPVSRDPDDDAVLALAVAARADRIVSGDADLLTLRVHAGIPIVDPASAIAGLDA